MKDTRSLRPLAVVGGIIIVAAAAGCLWYRKRKEAAMLPSFKLSSPAFADGGAIPAQYTCKGANSSPPLHFADVPEDTASLALVLHDPDAPGGDFLHWAIWNILPAAADLPAEAIPSGSMQGLNDFGTMGYGGPCPPSGTHRYMFDAYALDTMLELPEGAQRSEVMEALQAHAIGQAHLLGTFSA